VREAFRLGAALDAYFDDLDLAGQRATARTYRSLLKPLRAAAAFDTPTCRAILANAVKAGRAERTVNLIRSALASFARWCIDRGYIATSPLQGVPYMKVRETPHRPLTPDQVRDVWAACDTDRNRLVVLLLLTGLRVAELCSLRRRDVTGDVAAVVGKGGRRRLIYLDELTRAYIERASMGPTGPGAVDQPSRLAKSAPASNIDSPSARAVDDRIIPAGTSAVRHRVMRLGARAGLPWVRPHSFRHAFASAWALETGDMLTLKELGGWQGDQMVRHYTRSAMQEVAIRKARDVGLTARLLVGRGGVEPPTTSL
jgi:integrase